MFSINFWARFCCIAVLIILRLALLVPIFPLREFSIPKIVTGGGVDGVDVVGGGVLLVGGGVELSGVDIAGGLVGLLVVLSGVCVDFDVSDCVGVDVGSFDTTGGSVGSLVSVPESVGFSPGVDETISDDGGSDPLSVGVAPLSEQAVNVIISRAIISHSVCFMVLSSDLRIYYSIYKGQQKHKGAKLQFFRLPRVGAFKFSFAIPAFKQFYNYILHFFCGAISGEKLTDTVIRDFELFHLIRFFHLHDFKYFIHIQFNFCFAAIFLRFFGVFLVHVA